MPPLFFSIVIPTLNEEKYLPRLLQDLTQQTYTNFEIIHVDGTSEDNTLKVAQKFKHKLHITSITTKTRNVGHQRNLGGKKAKGKWIDFAMPMISYKKHFCETSPNN